MRAATARAATRFHEIVTAAQRTFAERGYRRTQVADVARTLEVSSGLVYHYFESKESLFHVALEDALDPEGATAPELLPVPKPRAEDTLAMVRGHIERWAAAPLLEEALRHERAADIRAELEALVRTLYDGAQQRRFAADLLERSALDLPELAALWFGDVRKAHFERLTHYLRLRTDAGQLRAMPDPAVAARIVIETIVFFARHRHRDPFEQIDDAAARETVVAFVLGALVV